MVYSLEIDHINAAIVSLLDRLNHDEHGDAELAAAVDHLGAARELLGGEVNEDAV